MKIVLALHQFPPAGSGGTEDLARWTALGLAGRGHEASIVSAVPRESAIALATPATLRVDGVDVRFLGRFDASPGTIDRIGLEYDDPMAGEAFGNALDEIRPDIVHFFHLHRMTAAAVRAATTRRIPVAVTCTDFWLECPTAQLLLPGDRPCRGPDDDRANCVRHLVANRLAAAPEHVTGPLAGALAWVSRLPAAPFERAWTALRDRSPRLREAIDSVDVVMAPTLYMRSRLLDFGVVPDRVAQVPYGVPAPDAAVVREGARADADGRLRIAFVGSLTRSKGAHLLLQALRMLPGLAAEVSVWGQRVDARYGMCLDDLARGDSRISFAGTFPADAFGSILAWTDALVIPSLWDENAPLVLLGALAHRCPVLVADVPGLTEPMRDGAYGWTFRRGDAQDLAARLHQLSSSADALIEIRRTARSTRTTADYMDDLLDIYERLSAPGRRTQ